MSQAQVWTKEEYLAWLSRRGEVGEWAVGDCRKADQHIEHYTLENLKLYLTARVRSQCLPQALADYITTCVWAHFGSVETDEMCKALNLYPEWAEKGDKK